MGYPNDFGDDHEEDISGFDWNVWTTIGLITLKSGIYIYSNPFSQL